MGKNKAEGRLSWWKQLGVLFSEKKGALSSGKDVELMGKEVGSQGGSLNSELRGSSGRDTRPAREQVGGRL